MPVPIDEFLQNRQAHRRMEIFEIHPIILGGNPTDLKNKIALNQEEHITAVRYWNKLIREIRGDNRQHIP